jgi:rod shape-determining protein MreD
VFGKAISVMDVTPMLLVILVVWISFAENRMVATLMGFLIGLMFDVLSNDIYGTNAIAKTITAFLSSTLLLYSTKEGRFYTRFKFLLITIVCTFIHNIIYFFFRFRPSSLDFYDFVIEKGLYFTAYTAVFALIALLIKPPRNVESEMR